MASQKSQNSNMLLAFITLLGVIVIVALVGFFLQAMCLKHTQPGYLLNLRNRCTD